MYKIVFVDDEDYIRDFFASSIDFSKYGFKLEKMFSAADQAWTYLENSSDISVVISDIKLGKHSGIDLCRRLREKFPQMILVLLSGYGEFEYAQQAIHLNVFEYLLKPVSFSALEQLFNRMKALLDTRTPLIPAEAKTAEISDTGYNDIMHIIKSYIDHNYMHDITLADVAAHVSMNPDYLSRFFKKKMNTNFSGYLADFRIRKAIELLADPTLRVCDLGSMVGYKSLHHFYKVFKQYTGCTPSEYRKRETNEFQP